MSDTSQYHCDKCGAAMSGFGAEGTCAACLLESAIIEPETPSDSGRVAPLLAFNDYELLAELARGGMGVVYRARQISLNRPVAIKMILGGHLANAAEMQRFRAEAETAAQLQHPNIVAIHEVGEHAGQPFFSMELVEGRNLAQLVRDDPLPSRKAAAYLKTIAEAVHYAHSRGVLHRDLKPSNVLLDEKDQPRITDFGLAKRLTDSQLSTNDPQLTQTGQVLGSPSFIPPEQAAGQKGAIGPASDVYSLGAILYHCLTGRPPFVAESLTQTLRLVAEQEPVSPRLLNAGVPQDLDTICLKCLTKEPRRRYETAQALAEDLGRYLQDEPILARPVNGVERVHRWCLRNKALASAGTAAVALLLIVAIGSPIAAIRINRERNQAQANEGKAQTEAIRSQEVAQFLQDMLKGVGPSAALGRDSTLLREILDITAKRLDHDLESQPAVEAQLRSTLGHVYRDLGEYTNAAAMHRRELEIYTNLTGSADQQVAAALYDLGEALRLQGRHAEAEPVVSRALEIRKRILADPHLDIARSKESLALVIYFSQNKVTEGEALLRESLETKTKLLGSNDLQVAISWHNLGVLLNQKRAFVDAEAANRRALEIRRQLLGNEHPDVATSMHGVGWSLYSQGKLAHAEKFYVDCLKLRRMLLDPAHPELAVTLLALGINLQNQKRLAEAENAFREALAMLEKRWGADHPATISPRFSLASVLRLQGQWSEAEVLYRKALANYDSSYGNWRPSKNSLLDSLVKVLLAQGKDEEAESVVKEQLASTPNSAAYLNLSDMVAQFRRSWPPDRETRKVFKADLRDILSRNVASLVIETENVAEAENLCRKIIELRKTILGDGHADTGNARFYLASLLCRQGKRDEAAALCREMATTWPSEAGHFYGRGGLFKEAAEAFRKKMESTPYQFENYRLLAPILLFTGDVEGYREVCHQLVNRFGATVDAVEADGIVRVCLLSADSRLDLKIAAGLADIAVEQGKQHQYRPWFEFGKALAEYRQKHFADAIIWANQALASPGQRERDASAYAVLAMAQWQTKDEATARSSQSKVAKLIAEELPALDCGDGGNWVGVIEAHVLLLEATALIRPGGAPGTDDSKED